MQAFHAFTQLCTARMWHVRAVQATACMLTSLSPMQALQKALDWLAEQPEDAAELAALLSEAAPKLGFNAQKSKIPGISRAATSRKSLELLHADMSLMQRLQAARPMLVGASSWLSS